LDSDLSSDISSSNIVTCTGRMSEYQVRYPSVRGSLIACTRPTSEHDSPSGSVLIQTRGLGLLT
jgi:hypothetical protein